MRQRSGKTQALSEANQGNVHIALETLGLPGYIVIQTGRP
jgi:hypothetical protein